jgi:protein tyrosine/serine phosphatase
MYIISKRKYFTLCVLLVSFSNISNVWSFSLSSYNKKNRHKVTQTFDNFFAVEEGKLYRCKQLDKARFSHYIDKCKIKTIVNLRGENKDRQWWKDEKQVIKEKDVKFFNIAMSAVRVPSKENITKLLEIYATAPRPILIHCQGGADRTGEASAVWVLDQMRKSTKEALKQLDIKYGHRKNKNPAKCFFINKWEGREWALTRYDHENYPQYC